MTSLEKGLSCASSTPMRIAHVSSYVHLSFHSMYVTMLIFNVESFSQVKMSIEQNNSC
jgi:hypothetical protein